MSQKVFKIRVIDIIVIVALIGLGAIIYCQQKEIKGLWLSLKTEMKNNSALRLENDLRNRGIIGDGELLDGEYKPYSLKQMEDFERWVAEKQTAENQ